MKTPSSDRVLVVFGAVDAALRDDALLIEGDAASPPGHAIARIAAGTAFAAHPQGCLCCGARGTVAEALGRLYIARARGEVPFFRRVVAVVKDRAAFRATLTRDVLAAARFELE
jgi:hypothetical protein